MKWSGVPKAYRWQGSPRNGPYAQHASLPRVPCPGNSHAGNRLFHRRRRLGEIASDTTSANLSPDAWQTVRVRAPRQPFKLVLTDEGPGWIAFQEPRELGSVSFLTYRIVALGPWLLASGVALFLLAFARCRPLNVRHLPGVTSGLINLTEAQAWIIRFGLNSALGSLAWV